MRQLKISKSITTRAFVSLDKYLQEIGKVELITAEEEIELAQKIRQGDQKALEKLTKANLRFVVSVAKQYQNQGLPLPDLINEGNLGLVKAATRFDESRGFKFISYAVWRIRQAILMAISEKGRIVRLPLNQVGRLNKIKNASIRLEQKLERLPTTEEVAEVLNLDEYDISSSLANEKKLSSLDAPLVDDTEGTLVDVVPDSDVLPTDHDLSQIQSLQEDIDRVLFSVLTEREATVLKMYYGLKPEKQAHTLDEIGAKFDLTRERIRQMKEKAIGRLKKSGKSKMLLKKFIG